MKYLKYSLIILGIAIITDLSLATAYPAVPNYRLIFQLEKCDSQWTEYRTKTEWSEQAYDNTETFTWLTNPCPKCQIGAKPYTERGDIGIAVVTVKGQKKIFENPTSFSAPDDYRLMVWRFDTTLLKTSHSANWIINS